MLFVNPDKPHQTYSSSINETKLIYIHFLITQKLNPWLPLFCIEIHSRFSGLGWGIAKMLKSAPPVLVCYDLSNEMSHNSGTFIVFNLPPTTPTWDGSRVRGETPSNAARCKCLHLHPVNIVFC